MKFCLGYMVYNEAPWLELHLAPLLKNCHRVEGVVLLDGVPGGDPELDGTIHDLEVFTDCPIWRFPRAFDWRFDQHRNTLIKHAEDLGFETMLFLDPDEAMFPAHVDQVAELLERYKIVKFPRYNFTKDRRHYCPQFYPDHQGRAFQLRQGIYYVGRFGVHETLWDTARALGLRENRGNPHDTDIFAAEHAHIYHYAGLNTLEERAFRNYVYDRIVNGKYDENDPYVKARTVPPGWDIGDYPPNMLFTGPQPLNPETVGVRAPVKE